MRLTFLHKDGGSNQGDCAAILATDSAPTAYLLGDQPGYVVQGVRLTTAEAAEVSKVAGANDAALGPSEGVVWVPANVIDRVSGGS